MKSTGESRPLELKVERALREAGVKDGARILAGVSGGPDSTALLGCLTTLAPRHGYTIEACIVDHGIREKSERVGDVEWVRTLCASLGAGFHLAAVAEGECEEQAHSERRSLEEVARQARLLLLQKTAAQAGAGVIALGHSRDDAVETLLMRVLQGSDARGLSGIPLRRGPFVRPLLLCRRSEILSYLELRGVGHRTDSSNADTRFLRNRIRQELLPVLGRVLPGFDTGLLGLAGRMSLLGTFIAEESAERLPWERADVGFRIPAAAFFSQPPALRAHSLYTLFDRLRPPGSPLRLPFRFLRPVLGTGRTRPGVLLRGYGVRLSLHGGSLLWERDIVTQGKKSYLIAAETDGIYRVRCAGVQVQITRGAQGSDVLDAEIRAGAVDPPLVLRSKRRGDGLLLEQGCKSLKELYSEWKVPAGERQVIPLLADRKGVVAVLGAARGYPTRIREGAQAGGDEEERIQVRIMRGREARGRTEGTSEQQFG